MSLVTVRQSRRERRCSEMYGPWAHDPTIRPGDLYARLTVPPHDRYTDVGNTTWMNAVLCIDCVLGGDSRTADLVIVALYARGVLEDYDIPPRQLLHAGIKAGKRVAAR